MVVFSYSLILLFQSTVVLPFPPSTELWGATLTPGRGTLLSFSALKGIFPPLLQLQHVVVMGNGTHHQKNTTAH